MVDNNQVKYTSYMNYKDPDFLGSNENMEGYILLSIGIIFAILLIIGLIYLLTSNLFSNKLINKYDNISKSQFSNKDQVDFSNENDYDIHYLVEQMIYKEFSPSDKKKYLNLPEALKDSFLKEYLIEKI